MTMTTSYIFLFALLVHLPDFTSAAPRVQLNPKGYSSHTVADSPDSAQTNPKDVKKTYQSGDLIYTEQQYQYYFNGGAETGRSFSNPERRWNQHKNNGRFEIAYTILNDTFKPSELTKLRNILPRVEEDILHKTALRLVPKEQNSEHEYWLEFNGRGAACSSLLGRVYNQQEIRLGEGCVYQLTIQHEIMHALGWYHEHQRPDRDKYINILWDNMSRSMKHNFKKFPDSTTHGTEYEAKSIMQYPRESFGKNSTSVTMEETGYRNQRILSRKEHFDDANTNRGFTDIDAYEINNVYSLKSHCESIGKKWYWFNPEKKRPFGSRTGNTPEDTCVDDIPRDAIEKDTPKWVTIGDEEPRTPTTVSPRTSAPACGIACQIFRLIKRLLGLS